MQISMILNNIDTGFMALPEFQRGYVWSRDQVRSVFDSLYRRHPIGGLLVWVTESKTAEYRGEGSLAPGIIKLILDGQQRITSLYGVARGFPPKFFDGNAKAFTGLRFHLDSEVFAFYQPIKMSDDPLWIDVTELMASGYQGLDKLIARLAEDPEIGASAVKYTSRISRILGIFDIDLHIEEIGGPDKTIDVVVDIFNRVNSGGTKLSKGDLALAKICADWNGARDEMKTKLQKWSDSGYQFTLDWLLRSVNTVLTGESKFQFIHEKSAEDVQGGLNKAAKHIDTCLNLIAGRLGLDHDRVFFSRFSIPVLVRYLDQRKGTMNEIERDKLLFWYVQSGMWGRFSSSTETYIDKDLEAIEGPGGGLDKLIDQLRLWHGPLKVEPEHFAGWSLGARFYPVLFMLTRMGEACDWGTGLPLKANLLGKLSRLEVHHIFPKSRLYKKGYSKSQVNALANFCFLTKETNLVIGNRLPEDYFPEIQSSHPNALASQWIPIDQELWKIENFKDFLEARQILLADEVNKRMTELLHGADRWLSADTPHVHTPTAEPKIMNDEQEEDLEILNKWVQSKGLSQGQISYDFSDAETGEQVAVFDIAWPNGVQEGLSDPVSVLLGDNIRFITVANAANYRCFNTIPAFKQYIRKSILVQENNVGY